jgi:hypothetical protein
VTLLHQLEAVISEKPSLTRFMRSKFPNFSWAIDEGGGCLAWDMLGCNARASWGLVVENKDLEGGAVGRFIK